MLGEEGEERKKMPWVGIQKSMGMKSGQLELKADQIKPSNNLGLSMVGRLKRVAIRKWPSYYTD